MYPEDDRSPPLVQYNEMKCKKKKNSTQSITQSQSSTYFTFLHFSEDKHTMSVLIIPFNIMWHTWIIDFSWIRCWLYTSKQWSNQCKKKWKVNIHFLPCHLVIIMHKLKFTFEIPLVGSGDGSQFRHAHAHSRFIVIWWSNLFWQKLWMASQTYLLCRSDWWCLIRTGDPSTSPTQNCCPYSLTLLQLSDTLLGTTACINHSAGINYRYQSFCWDRLQVSIILLRSTSGINHSARINYGYQSDPLLLSILGALFSTQT